MKPPEKLAGKKFFDKAWRGLSLDRQIEIVDRLLNDQDETTLVEWLVQHTGLDAETADRVASALLPDGHCRLGLRAIKKILPHMEAGKNYPDAAKAAGYDHALLPTGEISATGRLPYYGEWLKDDVIGTGDDRDKNDKRWGRFPNPTVHIGLGQIRRVVKRADRRDRRAGGDRNRVDEKLQAVTSRGGQKSKKSKPQTSERMKPATRKSRSLDRPVNARNRLKMRLWEELNLRDPLDRRCPYTGEIVSIARLLSSEVDIDHLIPFQDCWDDSAANKIVCLTEANRRKGKHTPFEAFGHLPDWDAISLRADALPGGKRWRFKPDARQRFEEQGGFLPVN